MHQLTEICKIIISKQKNLKKIEAFGVWEIKISTIMRLLLTDLTKFVNQIELTTNEIDINL